jgi:hypothetical protein
MDDSSHSNIHIFCDGGIGNRINALISGLALANQFALKSTIYWPINSWCGASFEDIFQNLLHVKDDAINELAGKFDHAKIMLHDEIGAQFLKVPFSSAYDYRSLDDFQLLALSSNCDIFFYPAIIPEWIPEALIHKALSELRFTQTIIQPVNSFIKSKLDKPFHGLHLRRTDLRVGLSDLEVMNLVQSYPDEVFYVCSDDPQAELLASSHPNVHARTKDHHVQKRKVDSEWISLSTDKEGRQSYGNIERSREAMIDGTIDLLILAHSQIVGYSGSTFQRMARLIGDVCPLLPLDRPAALPFVSSKEIKRQLEARVLPLNALLQICNKVGVGGRVDQAIELLQEASKFFAGQELCSLLHTLAVFHLNQGQAQMAKSHLLYVLSKEPLRGSSWLHLAYADLMLDDLAQASRSMHSFASCSQGSDSPAEQLLIDFLKLRLPH